MKNWKLILSLALLPGAFVGSTLAQAAKPLYENNFEQVEAGKTPDDFLVLDGGFAVKAENGNKFLELPGAPLDSFGVLFGPTEKSDVAASARIKGARKGRRFPTFAVGLDGQGGYRLQVSPAKDALELYHGDIILTNAPYAWKSGEWTELQLQITSAGANWRIEGKAWTQGATEPPKPLIVFEEKTEPSAGRASIWGSPFSNLPIQFDDLAVKSVAAGK
jgi:hypothetical protein